MTPRRAIFITGGGSGIGRAVAQLFGGRGWFTGLADIDEAGMNGTLALLPPGSSWQVTLDVRDRAGWDAALQSFSAAAGGRIDAVFNNAGVPLGGMIEEYSAEEIGRCLDINLKGVIFGAQAAYPHLRKTAPGSCLLNTSSAAGIYGLAGGSVYSATKFGVRAITEALDIEWAADRIKVASLMPGFIETPLIDRALNRGSTEVIRDQVRAAGLELSSASEVAEAAWDAVNGKRLHVIIGKTAKKAAFAARWMPGYLRSHFRRTARDILKRHS